MRGVRVTWMYSFVKIVCLRFMCFYEIKFYVKKRIIHIIVINWGAG